MMHRHFLPIMQRSFIPVLLSTIVAFFALLPTAFSQEEQQEQVIDQVVAVVGKSIILESDIQN